jgi:hypothetical protein
MEIMTQVKVYKFYSKCNSVKINSFEQSSLEANSYSATAFYGTNTFICVYKNPPLGRVTYEMNPLH